MFALPFSYMGMNKKTESKREIKMNLLKRISIRNVMAGIAGTFKDPIDKKLIEKTPELILIPKIILVPELTPDPIPALNPRPASTPKPIMIPKLTLVPKQSMDAALILSEMMVTQLNARR